MPLTDDPREMVRLMATSPHRNLGFYPIKTRAHSEDLSVDVSKVVAYRVLCACGWVSPSRSLVSQARSEYKKHENEENAALLREAEPPTTSEEAS